MIRCYVFDIDGTLADCSHRLYHIQKEPKDWAAFFAGCLDDAPIAHMINLLRAVKDSGGVVVVYVSGRSDECRDDTQRWLLNHAAVVGPLYMRKAGDHRDDDIVKIELLAQLRDDGFEPVMVFEDRARVVKAWRAAGIPCCQVADGDF
jgi:phosphoglycolate phosphatase-like HAD superfamily hydrolase